MAGSYTRTTKDEFHVEANYGFGWEIDTICYTSVNARELAARLTALGKRVRVRRRMVPREPA